MNKEKLRQLYEGCSDKYAAAKAFGSTYQSMYNLLYKDGTTCKVDLLERIASYFNVPVRFFFDEGEQNAVASGNGSVAVNGNNTVGNVTIGDNSSVLQERITMLERLLDEKERVINLLMKK